MSKRDYKKINAELNSKMCLVNRCRGKVKDHRSVWICNAPGCRRRVVRKTKGGR